LSVNKLKKELFDNKETLNFLEKIAGDLAPEIIKLYKAETAYSPEQISIKLNEKITNVRSTLNSLHYRGIACYKKKKNKNNMYEFYWGIKFRKVLELVIEQESENFKKADNMILDKKDRDYFNCPKNCIEVPFEIAAAYNFKCPNCNSTLKLINNKNKITSLKRKKTKIQKNITRLNEILNKIVDHSRGYICD
jgi:transcription initiation factor TFIIE subunit alpha